MTDYSEWVKTLQEAGFDMVCVVNKSYQAQAYTDPSHVPSAWQDAEGTTINENQELVNPWFDAKRTNFKFFKASFNIVTKEEWGSGNGCFIGAKGKGVLLGCVTPNEWILAYGRKKDKENPDQGGKLADARGAFAAAAKACLDDIKEDLS